MNNFITTFVFLISFNVVLGQDIMMQNDKNLNDEIRKVLETPKTASSFLAIRLFPKALFDDSIKTNLIYREDFDGLISVIVLNLKEVVKSVNKDEILHWNISVDNLFEMSKQNTKILINDLMFESVNVNESMRYFFAFNEQNYFVNSILYFPELLSKFDFNNLGIVIGIPVRSACTVMPVKSISSIYDDLTIYYNFLIKVYTNEDNPTSLNMILYKNGECYPILPVYDEDNNFVNFLAPDILSK